MSTHETRTPQAAHQTPPRARPGRRIRLAAATAFVLAAAWSVALPGSAGAEGPSHAAAASLRPIDVIQVQGMLDPMNASLIERTLDRAERSHSLLVVLRIDSPGALDIEVARLVARVRDARVPVVAWIGPRGAVAKGAAALVAMAADVRAIAPGARLGPVLPVSLDRPGAWSPADARDALKGLGLGAARATVAATLTDTQLRSKEALAADLVDIVEPVVGEVIVAMDGRRVLADGKATVLDTAKVVETDKGPRREPSPEVAVRLEKLDLGPRLQHALTSPSVALLMLAIGAGLVIFEFFTASIGVAGLTGAVALCASVYSFSHLPAEPWAVALVTAGFIGFAIDVQAGVLAFWTVAGTLATLVGASNLFAGSSQLDAPIWVVLAIVAGLAVFMLAGMTSVIRSRFSTPTVGRESMVGEMGEAATDVRPDGIVLVRGARWSARTNRATPITARQPIRVVAVEGLVLEVEPEEGAARDYRR